MISKFALLACLLSSPLWATWSLVQAPVPTGCSLTTTCTQTIAATGTGHVIVVAAVYVNPTPATFVSVSGGGTYTECGACANNNTSESGQQAQRVAFTLSSTPGATSVTVVLSVSVSQLAVHVREYAFTGPSAVFDTSGSMNGTLTVTTQSGVPLTVAGSDLIVQGIFSETTCNAVASPYGNLVIDGNNGCVADHLNVASGTDSPVWTVGSGLGAFVIWGLAIRETTAVTSTSGLLLPLTGAGGAGTPSGGALFFGLGCSGGTSSNTDCSTPLGTQNRFGQTVVTQITTGADPAGYSVIAIAWRMSNTDAANFHNLQVGLFPDVAGSPGTGTALCNSGNVFIAPSTPLSWIEGVPSGCPVLTPNTAYWIAFQQDATTLMTAFSLTPIPPTPASRFGTATFGVWTVSSYVTSTNTWAGYAKLSPR